MVGHRHIIPGTRDGTIPGVLAITAPGTPDGMILGLILIMAGIHRSITATGMVPRCGVGTIGVFVPGMHTMDGITTDGVTLVTGTTTITGATLVTGTIVTTMVGAPAADA